MKLLPLLLEDGAPGWYGREALAEEFEITPQQFEDALEELEKAQIINRRHFGREDPFALGNLQPTVNLAVEMGGEYAFEQIDATSATEGGCASMRAKTVRQAPSNQSHRSLPYDLIGKHVYG